MINQIFKEPIPRTILFDFLEHTTERDWDHYVFDSIAFRRANYNSFISEFIEKCRPYYHQAKQKHYLDKTMTYKTFVTILRQICNFNNIPYINKTIYVHSKHEIIYWIYFDSVK